jgi:ribonuclease BN (tRNA processing enzyme)
MPLPIVRTAWILVGLALGGLARGEAGDDTPFCGNEGVWIQILGAGGPDLDDGQSGPAYLLFIDNAARLLVDTAPGSSGAFDKAGGRFADLDAIVFTQLSAHHASDFPAFIEGSLAAGRQDPLTVLGPDGAEPFPGLRQFVDRQIGARGAFPYLAGFLAADSGTSYPLNLREVVTDSRRAWSAFRSENLSLAAVPVHHGPVPALSWRVEVGDQSIVFTGDFSNRRNVMAEFAAGADVLVIHHAIPEGARGEATDLHVTPSQIGRIAAQAGVRMVILGHRTARTRGLESISRSAIEANFDGPVIFANDLECWGL